MFELTEEQQAVCTSMRRFAQRELRWRARKLDTAPPGTVDWELLRKSCDLVCSRRISHPTTAAPWTA